jgi:hypothetical protein
MKRQGHSKWGWSVGAACLALAWQLFTSSPGEVIAQQSPRPATAGSASDPAAAAPAAKLRLRLPTYFSSVVTPKQRDEIYKLQQEFAEKLTALQQEIEKLMVERDQALDGVLEPDQLAAVNKKREEAKQRRATRAAPTTTEATEAESP